MQTKAPAKFYGACATFWINLSPNLLWIFHNCFLAHRIESILTFYISRIIWSLGERKIFHWECINFCFPPTDSHQRWNILWGVRVKILWPNFQEGTNYQQSLLKLQIYQNRYEAIKDFTGAIYFFICSSL